MTTPRVTTREILIHVCGCDEAGAREAMADLAATLGVDAPVDAEVTSFDATDECPAFSALRGWSGGWKFSVYFRAEVPSYVLRCGS